MEIKLGKRKHICSQFCLDTVMAILTEIDKGATNYHACFSNGVHEDTFYLWIKQGKLDMKHGIESLHSDLVRCLYEIESNEIKTCRHSIRINEKGHNGAQWTLERVYWKWFGSNAPAMMISAQLERMEEKGEITEDEKNAIEKQMDSKSN